VLPVRADLAASLNNLGLSWLEEEVSRANQLFVEAAGLLAELVHQSPTDPSLRSELAVALNNQGMTAERLGRLQDSALLFRRAIEHQQAAYESSGHSQRFAELLARHQGNLNRVLDADARRTVSDDPS
jgi:hypothetical protein